MIDGNELDDGLTEDDVEYDTYIPDQPSFVIPRHNLQGAANIQWANAHDKLLRENVRENRILKTQLKAFTQLQSILDNAITQDGADKTVEIDTPPPQSSPPVLESRLGNLAVTWDGTDYRGGPMPSDFVRLDVYAVETSRIPAGADFNFRTNPLEVVTPVSEDSSGDGPNSDEEVVEEDVVTEPAPDDELYPEQDAADSIQWPPLAIGSITLAGASGVVVLPDLKYNTEYTVWFLSVDRAGNIGDASERRALSIQPIVDTDIIGRIIDQANIELGAIDKELLNPEVKAEIDKALSDAGAAVEGIEGAVNDAQEAKDEAVKAVNDAADALEKALESAGLAEAVSRRGTNLITNGFGENGDNRNFSRFNFSSADAPVGSVGAFTPRATVQGATFLDDFITVDPSQPLVASMAARQVTPGVTSRVYLGMAPYDAFKNPILPSNYMEQAGTRTTLAAELKPGDTTIQLTSTENWTNDGSVGDTRRSMIAWNYVDPSGRAWPPGTYSRNWWNNLWSGGGISGNTITLRVPWSGITLPAGTVVGNGSSGGTYMYAFNTLITNEWADYVGSVPFQGVHTNNTLSATFSWPAATAQAIPVILHHYNVSGGTSVQRFAKVSLSPVAAVQQSAANAQAKADKAETDASNAKKAADEAAARAAAAVAQGVNVIENGSFENGFTGWASTSPYTLQQVPDAKHGKFVAQNVKTTDGWPNLQSARIQVTAGQTWRLKAWWRVTDRVSNEGLFQIMFRNTSVSTDVLTVGRQVSIPAIGEWVELVSEYTIPEGITEIWAKIQTNSTTRGTFQVDNVSLVNVTEELALKKIADDAAAAAATADQNAKTAKDRADEAHGLAGQAAATAAAAQITASQKNRTFRSLNEPSGTAFLNDTWEQWSSLATNGNGKLLAFWRHDGVGWRKGVLDETYLPLVNIGQGTYGELTGSRLTALSVQAGSLAANSVIASKIQADAVTADKILAGSVTTAKLAAEAVIAEKIAADSITADKIVANAITTPKIAANSIIGDHIVGNSITGNKIQGNTITGDKIQGNTISGDKIMANAITSGKINAGAIDGMTITGAVIRGGIVEQVGASSGVGSYTFQITANEPPVDNANQTYIPSVGTSTSPYMIQATPTTDAPGSRAVWGIPEQFVGATIRVSFLVRRSTTGAVWMGERSSSNNPVTVSANTWTRITSPAFPFNGGLVAAQMDGGPYLWATTPIVTVVTAGSSEATLGLSGGVPALSFRTNGVLNGQYSPVGARIGKTRDDGSIARTEVWPAQIKLEEVFPNGSPNQAYRTGLLSPNNDLLIRSGKGMTIESEVGVAVRTPSMYIQAPLSVNGLTNTLDRDYANATGFGSYASGWTPYTDANYDGFKIAIRGGVLYVSGALQKNSSWVGLETIFTLNSAYWPKVPVQIVARYTLNSASNDTLFVLVQPNGRIQTGGASSGSAGRISFGGPIA